MPSKEVSNTLCLYSAHFEGGDIPDYIRAMLVEINKYCSNIVLITEHKKMSYESMRFLVQQKIKHKTALNRGMDFGKWYTVLKGLNAERWDRIILLNDSMLLLHPLDTFFNWCNNSEASVKGLLNSNERQAHIQSYFLVLEKEAIHPTIHYFKEHKRFSKKRKIIRFYELGLSAYWQELNLAIESFIDINTIEQGCKRNPSYFLLEELIKKGIPMIKRHVIMGTFGSEEREALEQQGFEFDKEYWLGLIGQ